MVTVTGDVDVVGGDLVESGVISTLCHGLETIFAKYDTCLLTVCGSTCSVICRDGEYALVDSHVRSGSGMLDAYGKSVVVYFRCLKDLENHICSLAGSLHRDKRLYEIAGVRVVAFVESVDFSSNVRVSKRKRSVGSYVSVVVSDVDSDVEFVSDVTEKTMLFDPIGKEVAQALCSRLEANFEKVGADDCRDGGLLESPCSKVNIVADGNFLQSSFPSCEWLTRASHSREACCC